MRVKALGHVWECVSVSVGDEWSYHLVTTDGRKFIIVVNATHEPNGEYDILLEKLVKEGFVDFDMDNNSELGDYYLVQSVEEV